MKLICESFKIIGEELRWLLRFDVVGVVFALIFLLLFVPSIDRYADNAVMLAASIDDEPFITMQLDGMTAPPYGNPGNYLKFSADKIIPQHWYTMRYYNLVYYGGLYLDIAFAMWMPLKALGVPVFPWAPILLRTLALLFSALFLLSFYNFSKRHLGGLAAAFGGIVLLASYHFNCIGSMIHPDSLLFFTGIVGLALVVRYCDDGKISSAVALGILAGLGQSAKMAGSVPLIPLTMIVIVATSFRMSLGKPIVWLKQTVTVGGATLLASLLAFFLTTPYAVFDSYYLDTWKAGSALLAGDSLVSPTGFIDWAKFFAADMNIYFILISLVGVMLACWPTREPSARNGSLALAFFSLSIFCWYAAFQKYWVQLQYLVLPIGAIGVFAGYALDRAVSFVAQSQMKFKKLDRVLKVSVIVGLIFFLEAKFFDAAARLPLAYSEWRTSSPIRVGDWARRNLSDKNGLILLHYGVYFDPSVFPKQKSNGGPLRYVDVDEFRPRYLTIAQPYGGWMRDNHLTDKREMWDSAYASLRLHQDLLQQNSLKQLVVKPDGSVPGIKHLHTVDRPPGCAETLWSQWWLKWSCTIEHLIEGKAPIFPAGDERIFLFEVDMNQFPKRPVLAK